MATEGKPRPAKPGAAGKGAGTSASSSRRTGIRPETEGKRFYTPGEVAELFGVTPKTVSNWCDQGRLESIVTPSGHRRIPESAIRGGREYDAKLRSLQGRLDVINAPVPAGHTGAKDPDE
ncbi:MAG: helix-turn-helix domain-containing protein [Candidatus Sericytochromatia bacterium]|nr:helix-turn-helix domain-containing protein [Candidatus Tanganyikabacteria bacterium]